MVAVAFVLLVTVADVDREPPSGWWRSADAVYWEVTHRNRELLRRAQVAMTPPRDYVGAGMAIFSLGAARATEAIPFLIEHITFDLFPGYRHRMFKSGEPVYERAPCVGALIDIGSRSLQPLMANIVRVDDPKVHRSSATVLSGMLGRKYAEAYVKRPWTT